MYVGYCFLCIAVMLLLYSIICYYMSRLLGKEVPGTPFKMFMLGYLIHNFCYSLYENFIIFSTLFSHHFFRESVHLKYSQFYSFIFISCRNEIFLSSRRHSQVTSFSYFLRVYKAQSTFCDNV